MMQSVGKVLDRVLADLGLEPVLQGWRAVERWPSIVGPRVAARTRAVSFREGTLHVGVEGSAWLHEMGFLKRDLLLRLHAALGSDEVKELRFTLGRARLPR